MQYWPECSSRRLIRRPQGKTQGGIKRLKAGLTHYSSKPGELAPPRRRITGEENLKFPLPKEGRGPPLRTWKQRFPNGGRNLRRRVLPQKVPLPHNARKGVSPPSSC